MGVATMRRRGHVRGYLVMLCNAVSYRAAGAKDVKLQFDVLSFEGCTLGRPKLWSD